MINSKNIAQYYKEIKDCKNFNEFTLEDLEKIIMYDLEYSSDFLLSQEIMLQYKEQLISEKHNVLFKAILQNQYPFVEFIFNNIDFNYQIEDSYGRNIAHFIAVNLGEKSLFLLKKIDIRTLYNKADHNNYLPLHYAILHGNHYFIEKSIMLLPTIDNNELNMLAFLSIRNFDFSCFNFFISHLSKMGFNLDEFILYRNPLTGRDALSEALNYCNFEVAYFLLQRGAILYHKMDLSLLIIEHIDDPKILKMLFNSGINSNQKNINGDHPLIFLIMNRNIEIEKKLKTLNCFVKHQFNVNIRDHMNNNLLHYAVLYKENPLVIEYLKKLGVIDNTNIDNINSDDLKSRPELREKYISQINTLYFS